MNGFPGTDREISKQKSEYHVHMTDNNERIITKSAILSLAGIVTLGALVYLLRGVIAPVLFAFLLAYAFNPFVEFLSRHKVSRTSASAICLIGLLIAGVSLVALILPTVQHEIRVISKNTPEYLYKIQNSILPWIEETFDVALPETLGEVFDTARKKLFEMSGDIAAPLADLLGVLLSSTMALLASLVYLIIIPLFTFYFLRDYRKITNWFIELIPLRYRNKSSNIFMELDSVLAGFIRGQLTICAILACVYSVFLSLSSVPAALTIGIIAGLFNLVPYLGTITGITLSSLFLLLEGAEWHSYMLVAIIFVGATILDGLLITPKILGKKLGLAPVAVILAILAFGELFGFTGILLAIPVTAIGKVFFRHVLEHYRKSRVFKETGTA